MSAVDIDIQLKVWKDLAVSKQVLMGAATEALGLNSECSTAELEDALKNAIQRAKEADTKVTAMRDATDKEMAEMKKQVASSGIARTSAEEKIAIAEKAQETAERQLSIGKTTSAETVKKARADVIEKDNKLKAISKALADTPDNVVKKLKNLKKQKLDESKLRTQAESMLKTVRKEKTSLETELKDQKALVEKSATLVPQIRELHTLCNEQNKKIESLSEDKEDLFDIPKLDEELLTSLEPESDEKDADTKTKGKTKSKK